MSAKSNYRIRNWSQYNKSLIQRGSITLWFSQETMEKWYSNNTSREKGRPRLYSNDAILCALLIRTVYGLTLRSLQGFLLSIVSLMELPILIPSYSQVCRRAKDLGKEIKKLSNRRPRDIVFDSTGLKVYGEGEWKVRQHGVSKRRTWRKLHIGMDPESGEIIVSELTDNGAGDSETAQKLMNEIPKGVLKIFGDGAYDGIEFRKTIEKKGAEPIIPPPKNAVIRENLEPAVVKRDNAIKEIIGLGGDEKARQLWKKLKGYHKRSLVETTMYRIKQLTGCKLKSRERERQCVEAYVKCLVINKMTRLGMPIGEWIEAA